MSGEVRPRVLHVYLDAPGGGPAHVDLLRDALGEAVEWDEVALDPRSLGPSPAGWMRAWAQVSRRAAGAALVHAHGVRAAAAARLAARRGRVPFVVTIHGLHSVRRSGGKRGLAALALNRLVLRSADRVLVLGEADRRTIVERRLAAEGKVRRIRAAHGPGGSVTRRAARRALGLPRTALVAVWLGRLAAEKDPFTFLDAIRRLERPEAIGLMVGDGPLLAEARARSDRSALDGRIRFDGWVPDPAPALAAADVFVSTSRWEGLPMAALEAAHSGLPLLLSDAPGNRDLVSEGIPALLVPVGDQEALARELDRLLGDGALRRRLGRRSRAAVRRAFGPQRLREDVLAAYADLLGAPVGRVTSPLARSN